MSGSKPQDARKIGELNENNVQNSVPTPKCVTEAFCGSSESGQISWLHACDRNTPRRQYNRCSWFNRVRKRELLRVISAPSRQGSTHSIQYASRDLLVQDMGMVQKAGVGLTKLQTRGSFGEAYPSWEYEMRLSLRCCRWNFDWHGLRAISAKREAVTTNDRGVGVKAVKAGVNGWNLTVEFKLRKTDDERTKNERGVSVLMPAPQIAGIAGEMRSIWTGAENSEETGMEDQD
ncbi:hypothetical protein DFH09DRAFT_1089176 [Mycena vulgaris]|nr:hypothetical protein DFH09DRAFT_1089176 [Mycena vulgaris]